MMKRGHLLAFLLLSFSLSSFIFTYFINISQCTLNNTSLSVHLNNIEYEQRSTVRGAFENQSLFDIFIPQNGWRASKIDLNFSNIHINQEVRCVEDQPEDEVILSYQNKNFNCLALNVQLRIFKKTNILGIYIHGRSELSIEGITFQVQAYNSSTFKPNGIIFYSQQLNMSTEERWHLQDFSSAPLSLNKGNYSLVINGTQRISSDKTNILFWSHNGELIPRTPGLHHGTFENEQDWTVESNKTLLYKVIQKVNKTLNPEEINLTAKINGNNYQIRNNFAHGTGNASVQINFFVTEKQIAVEIQNNYSIHIKFLVNYIVSLMQVKNLNAELIIMEGRDVYWEISFLVNRSIFNFFEIFVDFSPYDWHEISLFKNGLNLTQDITLDEIKQTLSIKNASVNMELSTWELLAHSSQLDRGFNVNYPESLKEIEAGNNLELSVSAQAGNITIMIFNTNGIEKYRNTIRHIPSKSYQFSFQIPQNTPEELWEVLIFWNNASHAASFSQAFTVTPLVIKPSENITGETPFDPLIIGGIVVVLAGLLSIGVTGYKGPKIIKNRFYEKNNITLNLFKDILNTKYLIVSEKSTGLNIYEKHIGPGNQNALIISGYLEAISKFEIAFTDSNNLSKSFKLEYKDSKIMVSDYEKFRITAIIKENPSQDMINSISSLSSDITQNYGIAFNNFKGSLNSFKGLDTLIEKHIPIYLALPFRISILKNRTLNNIEKKLIFQAQNLLELNKYFYLSQILSEIKLNYITFKTTFELIEKRIFIPETSLETKNIVKK
ncbi:MAG: hypothetical protein JW891_06370 [Candidatus Lokiarchaeota archaeon]|nr:hypothetical protein [Candidatus Lokiarchaeota archaeon]